MLTITMMILLMLIRYWDKWGLLLVVVQLFIKIESTHSDDDDDDDDDEDEDDDDDDNDNDDDDEVCSGCSVTAVATFHQD